MNILNKIKSLFKTKENIIPTTQVQAPAIKHRLKQLTDIEIDKIFVQLEQNRKYQDIASELQISVATVGKYALIRRRRLKHKAYYNANRLATIRKRHMAKKQKYPRHDLECPLCNPTSTLTFDQYASNVKIWIRSEIKAIRLKQLKPKLVTHKVADLSNTSISVIEHENFIKKSEKILQR